jgi:AcrR family transcriptional regulator
MTSRERSPRRERILAAAENEFAAHGMAGARVERIALAAGVNKQLLFHYFGSKTGLYRAVVDSVARRVDLRTPSTQTPAERIRGLLAVMLPAYGSLGRVLPSDFSQRATGAVREILEDGQRRGYVRDDVDPGAVAQLVAAAAAGWGSASVPAGAPSPDDASARFNRLLSTVITDYCAWR